MVQAASDTQPQSDSVDQEEKLVEVVDTGLSLVEMQEVAQRVNAKELLVLRPTDTTDTEDTSTYTWILMEGMGIGVERSLGDMLTIYTDIELRDGMWLFQNGGMVTHVDGFTLTIDPGTLVVVGSENISAPIEQNFVKTGSVQCGEGYYACCGTNVNGQWRAKCMANDQQPTGGADYPVDCTNGGLGATGCSNGGNAYLVYDPR